MGAKSHLLKRLCMPFVVELYFDASTEQQVAELI